MRTTAKLGWAAVGLVAVAAGAGWFLTAPQRVSSDVVAALGPGDAEAGRRIFFAGGCASCHAAPGSEGEALLELPGGVSLVSAFGTFVAPNISQHPTDGIGNWSSEDLANAMLNGVAPDGSHLYPAFPYPSYTRMAPSDIGDLYAFLKTTPQVAGGAAPNEVGFPFSVRRGLGLWKAVNLDSEPVVALAPDASEQVQLGRYLVEGPGHCGECHTPRDSTGGLERSQWLAGGIAAEGEGIIPNITPDGSIGDWSQADLVTYFETGFTPDFDVVGGPMAEVQKNLAQLRPEDREAIAAYLKAIPGKPNGYPASN
ncbi:MAG TPA: cytochrome c [Tianweitania sediminis]|jgi:mono/diheme cytochrome c family protein|nr:cytochrome c [Tianweitania sediminis]